jgi:hypothetical protein
LFLPRSALAMSFIQHQYFVDSIWSSVEKQHLLPNYLKIVKSPMSFHTMLDRYYSAVYTRPIRIWMPTTRGSAAGSGAVTYEGDRIVPVAYQVAPVELIEVSCADWDKFLADVTLIVSNAVLYHDTSPASKVSRSLRRAADSMVIREAKEMAERAVSLARKMQLKHNGDLEQLTKDGRTARVMALNREPAVQSEPQKYPYPWRVYDEINFPVACGIRPRPGQGAGVSNRDADGAPLVGQPLTPRGRNINVRHCHRRLRRPRAGARSVRSLSAEEGGDGAAGWAGLTAEGGDSMEVDGAEGKTESGAKGGAEGGAEGSAEGGVGGEGGEGGEDADYEEVLVVEEEEEGENEGEHYMHKLGVQADTGLIMSGYGALCLQHDVVTDTTAEKEAVELLRQKEVVEEAKRVQREQRASNGGSGGSSGRRERIGTPRVRTEEEVREEEVKELLSAMVATVEAHSTRNNSLEEGQFMEINGGLVKEHDVWGIDCYTRRNIELALDGQLLDEEEEWDNRKQRKATGNKHGSGVGVEKLLTGVAKEDRRRLQRFIDQRLLTAINLQPTDKAWDMDYALAFLEAGGKTAVEVTGWNTAEAEAAASTETKETKGGAKSGAAVGLGLRSVELELAKKAREAEKAEKARKQRALEQSRKAKGQFTFQGFETACTPAEREAARQLRKAIKLYGYENFRIFPKGCGVMCSDLEGIRPHKLVTEYIGEIYPPWRWAEKNEAIEEAQRVYNSKPTLPDFYNIVLERPKHERRGYDLLYLDASKRANFASRFSHSCEPNCVTAMAVVRGRLICAVHTQRRIEQGEELTIDYNAATDSEAEMRAGICLCGSAGCRGSFLSFTGSGHLHEILAKRHAPLHRLAMLVHTAQLSEEPPTLSASSADDDGHGAENESAVGSTPLPSTPSQRVTSSSSSSSPSSSSSSSSSSIMPGPYDAKCSGQVGRFVAAPQPQSEALTAALRRLPKSVRARLNRHGIRESCLGGGRVLLPRWLLLWVDRVLSFVEEERTAMPGHLMKMDASKLNGLSFHEHTAKLEAAGLVEQRVQSLAASLDKISFHLHQQHLHMPNALEGLLAEVTRWCKALEHHQAEEQVMMARASEAKKLAAVCATAAAAVAAREGFRAVSAYVTLAKALENRNKQELEERHREEVAAMRQRQEHEQRRQHEESQRMQCQQSLMGSPAGQPGLPAAVAGAAGASVEGMPPAPTLTAAELAQQAQARAAQAQATLFAQFQEAAQDLVQRQQAQAMLREQQQHLSNGELDGMMLAVQEVCQSTHTVYDQFGRRMGSTKVRELPHLHTPTLTRPLPTYPPSFIHHDSTPPS